MGETDKWLVAYFIGYTRGNLALWLGVSIGACIGAYGTLCSLGARGTDGVYRARDTTLGRGAALKVLPPAFAAVSLALVLTFASIGAAQEPTGHVEFRWAFGALRARDPEKLIQVSQNTALNSDDRLKFYVEPLCRCFIYLLFESAQKELTVLFPSPVTRLDTRLEPKTAFYVPDAVEWLILDKHPGVETVHLIASANPLVRMTSLLRSHESAPPDRKASAVAAVLAEIRHVKLEHLRERAVERPIAIGGGVRGPGPDITSLAVAISAQDFYSKTFTIDHR